METRVTRDRDWIVTRFLGPGTTAEVKAAFLTAIESAESAGLSRILIDSVDSTVHPAFDDMRDLARFAISLRKSKLPKTALIVRGTLQFGLARMFASLVEFTDWEFRIFKTGAEAESWLAGQGSETAAGGSTEA